MDIGNQRGQRDVPDAGNKSVKINDISTSALAGLSHSFMPQTGILNVEYQFMQPFQNNWFKMRFDIIMQAVSIKSGFVPERRISEQLILIM